MNLNSPRGKLEAMKPIIQATTGRPTDVSIDSFKIRIPLADVEILNPEITTLWGEVSSEGEISSYEFKAKRFTHRNKGGTTSYLIQKRKTGATTSDQFLILLINSKILESHYFQGITAHNIAHVYNLVMIQGHVRFSFDSFINAALTDCDIKRDFPTCGTAHQEEIVKGFKELTRASKTKAKGMTTTINQRAIMIQWSKRDVAKPSSPHVKFYSKDLELKYKSFVFADVNDIPDKSILRLEATIKDRDHFRYLMGTKSKDAVCNLNALLSTSQDKLTEMITSMLHKHVEAPTTGGKAAAGQTLSEAFASALIASTKKSKYELIQWLTGYTSDKHQQLKAKKMVLKLWNNEQTDKNLLTDEVYTYVFGR